MRDMRRIALDRAGLDMEKYVVIDPAFYRPAEVEILLDDGAKAKIGLGTANRARSTHPRNGQRGSAAPPRRAAASTSYSRTRTRVAFPGPCIKIWMLSRAFGKLAQSSSCGAIDARSRSL